MTGSATTNALRFDISINPLWPGEKLPPGDNRWSRHTASFYQERHTIESLLKRIAGDGCAFAAVMKGGYRQTANFRSAQHIALDDDRGTLESSLDALAADPFIANRAAFLYESPSSTPAQPRSRVVFILDQPFLDSEEYRIAQEAMCWKFSATDERVKEPARFFYGRPNANHLLLGNILFRDVLQEEVIEPYLRSRQSTVNSYFSEPINERITEGQRNAALTSLAGTMRRREMSESAIAAALLEENAQRCTPPLLEDEVRRIAESISRYPPGSHSKNGNLPHVSIPEIKPETDWPKPMAEAAYHGLTGQVVRTIEPHTEADPAALLINFLEYFGNAVGRGPHGIVEADRHGTNLNAVLVGTTSKARKGSSRGHIHELFRRVDPTWVDTKILGGMSSGEGLIWAVRDPIERTDAVKEKGKFTGNYETHIVDQGVADKRLLVYEPEFASVLKVMARDSNTLSAQIRQAWDSGDLRTMVKNNPAVASGTHISILGHITKEELLRYLTDIEAGNGFANRFLWIHVKRSKVLPEGGGTPDYNRLVLALHGALDRAKNLGQLARDNEAKEAWAGIYEDLSGDASGLFGAVTARAEAQVFRLSVLYAAIDGAEVIQLPHLNAALAVWEFAQHSAKCIFGDPTADRVLEALKFGELTRTDINHLFQRNISSARITQALNPLLQTKRAGCERRETEGRTLEVWTINRG